MCLLQRLLVLQVILFACILGVNSVPQANAANLEKGMVAYKKGDYEAALTELKPLAIKGNVKAQFNLGKIYSTGKAAIKDKQEAIKWYTKAAEQKDAFSQYTLGHIYAQENSFYKDYVKAYAWYNLALSQGNESARKGRDSVMMKMTPKQVAKGIEKYKQIYKKIYGAK